MDTLKIAITGTGAEDAEKALQELLREEFGVEGRRVSPDAGEREPGRKIDATTLEIVMLAVSLPGAIDASVNLVKRVELTHKVKRLIAWARGRSGSGSRISLISPRGRAIDIEHAEAGEVVAALTEARDNNKADRKS